MKPFKALERRALKLRREAAEKRVRAASLQITVHELQREAAGMVREAVEIEAEVASRKEANRAALARQYSFQKQKEAGDD